MELLDRSRIARVLYGALFVVVVPLALVAWAHGTAGVVHLPVLHSALWGTMLISFGVVTMALGMLSLWIYGGGLPMNADRKSVV